MSSEVTNEDDEGHHEPNFDPIISLPEIEVPTLEEEETILIQTRAKLFRLDSIEKEWKERGTGEIKLLHHQENRTVRVVMRRDKTLKLCANHYVTQEMDLKPNCGSDRAWVWLTKADYADQEVKPEILAIRFLNAETASQWKTAFDSSKLLITIDNLITNQEGVEDTENKYLQKVSDKQEHEQTGDNRKDIGDGSHVEETPVVDNEIKKLAKETATEVCAKENIESNSKLSDELEKLKIEETTKKKIDNSQVS